MNLVSWCVSFSAPKQFFNFIILKQNFILNSHFSFQFPDALINLPDDAHFNIMPSYLSEVNPDDFYKEKFEGDPARYCRVVAPVFAKEEFLSHLEEPAVFFNTTE